MFAGTARPARNWLPAFPRRFVPIGATEDHACPTWHPVSRARTLDFHRPHSSRDHPLGPGRGAATDSHPDSASFLKR